jgi:PGF-CTERM protein
MTSGNAHRLLTAVLIAGLAVGGVGVVAGTASAHADGDGLTVHNQTRPLDAHGEVHTITVDRATADTEFYVDVHSEAGDRNTTRTFDAGTTLTDLELALSPTITEETTVTVATHAANGTELANETITVTPVSAPTVEFDDQVREFDAHDEVHTITVDTAAANQRYYVDVHSEAGDRNTTRTFDAGTAQTDLELVLSPTIESTQNVTVAVHAANGTELAAETATVTTVELDVGNQTGESSEIGGITVDAAGAGTAYYVDVHSEGGDLNTTRTFDAGTRQTDLGLDLSPAVTSDRTVTVAVHAADGTELAAERVALDVSEASNATATPTATNTSTEHETAASAGNGTTASTEHETTGHETENGGPGFGAVVAVLALLTAGLLAARREA